MTTLPVIHEPYPGKNHWQPECNVFICRKHKRERFYAKGPELQQFLNLYFHPSGEADKLSQKTQRISRAHLALSILASC